MIGFDAATLDEEGAASADEAIARIRENRVDWVDVQGLGDGEVVRRFGELLDLHVLAVADVVNQGQRPKVDDYEETILFVLRMVRASNEEGLAWEQVSVVLAHGCLLTFQETYGDCLDPLRERIRAGGKRLRSGGQDYLAIQIVDAVVDGYFPVVEYFADALEALEEAILADPRREHLTELYSIKRELMAFRRATWPLREGLISLSRSETELVGDSARLYLRDTLDPLNQVSELAETYRELSSSLVDVYLSLVGQRTGEVTYVLTIVATIFIPLTFVAGIYGMNFDTDSPFNLPELGWRYGYVAFWITCLVLTSGLLLLFRRLGWLGRR